MNTLKLLAGIPIIIEPDLCLVTPLTLKQIAALGLENYYKYVNLITLSYYDILEIIKTVDNLEELDINDSADFSYRFITESCLQHDLFYQDFKSAIRLFTGEDIHVIEIDNIPTMLIGEYENRKIVDVNSFSDLQNIIRAQNNMDIEKPISEAERKMKEKFEKNKKMVEDAKKRQGIEGDDSVAFDSLVSSLAANGNGLNILNVWDLTMYGFHDQFQRMRAIEEYEQGINFICAGADPEKVKLKHYIRNIIDQ